jgi:protocatechuate 3,4-dioxygenase beta subunit
MLSNARFLVVAFVASAAISLAWQYHAAQRGVVDSNTADQAAVSDEAGGETAAHDLQHNDSNLSTRHPRQAASGDGKAMNRERAGDESRLAVPVHEETYIFEYDEEWVGTLHTKLYSPDPLPLGEPEEFAVISGRVLTPSGRAVSDVEVTAQFRNYFKSASGYTRDTVPRTRKTRTNDDGFYAFQDLPAGTYMIGTEESTQYAAERVEVRTGVKYADLVLAPQRYAIVRGVVTDPMGAELERVRVMPLVKGAPSGTTTDANGEFAIGVAVGQEARRIPLRFQLDGFREQRFDVTDIEAAVAGSMPIALTMEPIYEFSTVSGSVKGPDGKQITGDYVRLYSPSLQRNYKAKIDDAGEFLLTDVEIADDYRLWILPSGPYRDFSEENFAVTPGSMRRDIVLSELDRSHRLRGRIVDQDGRPIPNYTLTLRSMAAIAQKLPVTSNGSGRFEVEGVPEGELVFESRTMLYQKISGLLIDGDYSERIVDLVLNHGRHKLLGKVVDEAGNPVATPRILITASRVNENGTRSQLKGSTSADAKGRFVFTDLASGEHTVTVHAPGYESIQVQPDIKSQGELVIKMQRTTS